MAQIVDKIESFFQSRLVKAIAISLSVVLSVGLIIMLIQDHQVQQRRAAHIASLSTEAKRYESEIRDIQLALAQRAEQIAVVPDQGTAVLAWRVNAAKDISYVNRLAKKYGFRPLILLDCAKSEDDLTELLSTIYQAEMNGDILLSGAPQDAVLDRARWVLDLLREYAYAGTVSFLLPQDADSPSNREQLSELELSGYVFYSDEGEEANGLTADPLPYVCYQVLDQEDLNMESVAEQIDAGRNATVLVLDCAAVPQKVLSEWVQFLYQQTQIRMADLPDAFLDVIQREKEMEARQADYAAYQAEQNQKIEALEQKIETVYSGWKDE